LVKGKFRVGKDGTLYFWCKGCNCYHGVPIDKTKPLYWDFNGDYDKPTLNPSILVKSGHYLDNHQGSCWCTYNAEHPDDEASFKCLLCHSFIRDGKIQYLSDCSHELAGQTVELEEPKDDDTI
jgi:hypothetical protein